jgi:hypothetical protein
VAPLVLAGVPPLVRPSSLDMLRSILDERAPAPGRLQGCAWR